MEEEWDRRNDTHGEKHDARTTGRLRTSEMISKYFYKM